jgi:hypothetical protein
MKKLFKVLLILLVLSACQKPDLTEIKPTTSSPISFQYKTPTTAWDSIFDRFDSLGVTASAGYKTIVQNVITNAIAKGQWYNKDFFFGWFAENETQSKVNWRNPYGTLATINNNYSGAFITSVGWKGNGTNFNIDLGVNFGDGGTYNFTQDYNSFGYYSTVHVNESKSDLSCLNSSSIGIELNSLATSFSIQSKNNSGTSRSVANYTNQGCVASVRTASNSWSITKNGYVLGANIADASNSVVNQNIFEFCRIVNGTKSLYSSKTHSYSWGGSSCDVFEFNSIIEEHALVPLGIAPMTRYIINGNSWTSNGTWIKRFMANNGYNYDVLVRGVSGKTTPQLLTDARATVFPMAKPYLSREVYYFQEFTNDFVAVSSNWQTAYNNSLIYLDSAKVYFPSAEFVLGEMPPRKASSIDTLKRDSLNIHIQANAVTDGWSRYVLISNNTYIGKNWSVTNTADWLVDQLHLVTTSGKGYNRYGDLVTPEIQ